MSQKFNNHRKIDKLIDVLLINLSYKIATCLYYFGILAPSRFYYNLHFPAYYDDPIRRVTTTIASAIQQGTTTRNL